MSIRLVVADDHVMLRQSLVQVISAQDDMQVMAQCDEGESLIQAVLTHQPDVVLMDISMPNMNGLVAIDKLLSQRPGCRVLVLTMHNEMEYVQAMQRAGAFGYLLKESSTDTLLKAIRQVALGKRVFPGEAQRSVTPSTLSQHPLDVLTRREREVFFLVVAGKTSKTIAELLNMSLKTVENHRSKILKKLQAGNVAELIRIAGKLGLLE
ncbi:response regulator transcription factor [Aliiglaciecola sp. CAU 1673]|uniref:response regulator n=1 Tax=Aliiglaciecola sp. CAU 1673 TaxID=3032595 RepID=UPI0023DC5628|nr:response regulator transcription factor [Aliiglaciecola sp. CAU 1673]MDF2178160.1 response regulator transcription factor [Aliiglaciecola sp. CAU 1673]